jgi:hypothetical protein
VHKHSTTGLYSQPYVFIVVYTVSLKVFASEISILMLKNKNIRRQNKLNKIHLSPESYRASMAWCVWQFTVQVPWLPGILFLQTGKD